MNVFYDRYDQTSRMLLHNNCIATFDHDNKRLSISNCGWFTPTTKERLNALPDVNIIQKSFKWFLNGKEWNGQKTDVCKWNKCIKNGHKKLKEHKKNPLLYSFLNKIN